MHRASTSTRPLQRLSTQAVRCSTPRQSSSWLTSNQKVKIVEVSPRDGLQNEKSLISADTKVELIHRLQDAGVQCIESGALVSPKWVPQVRSCIRA